MDISILPEVRREGMNAGVLPVYREIEQHFTDLIVRGRLAPGDRLPSIAAVAAHASVNARTVMQAYQCLAEDGLVETRNGRGTFVANTRVHANTLILMGWGWDNEAMGAEPREPYSSTIYTGIREEATIRGLVCCWSQPDTDVRRVCRSKDVAGCIIQATGEESVATLLGLERAGVRVISIGGRDKQSTPLVRGDDSQGIYLVMEHLFELGHRRIAFLNGPLENFSARRRLDAYMAEMTRRDAVVHPSWVCHDNVLTIDRECEDKLLERWFGSSLPPTAIVAAGSSLALVALQMLHRAGKRVPDEMSVCGYDDYPGIQEFTSPALTTIRQPVKDIGRVAVRNMEALLKGETVRHTVLPVQLIPRASTGRAPF